MRIKSQIVTNQNKFFKTLVYPLEILCFSMLKVSGNSSKSVNPKSETQKCLRILNYTIRFFGLEHF